MNHILESSFKPDWPCLIVEVLAIWVKFLEPSNHSFYLTNIFDCFHSVMAPVQTCKVCKFLCCSFICAAFKSYTEWSNAQHVSTPSTMILLITVGTLQRLKCFGHLVYVLQTRIVLKYCKTFDSLFCHDLLFLLSG